MKILKFTLTGKNAFFKKPDVNSILYFTYGNIHKVAIMGIFGAILGYSGYNQMNYYNNINSKDKLIYPEFYDKLKDIKISIVPNNKTGSFEKKVQYFNNSVGYASKEEGGNLIVKEQWIENPSWDIYIEVNDNVSQNIAESILNKKSIYIPYLGKNDHIANISDIKLYEEDKVEIIENSNRIDSLFIENMFQFDDFYEEYEDEDNEDDTQKFKYQERLPIGLEKETNLYITEKFIFTNMGVSKQNDIKIFKLDDKKIIFF